MKAVGFLSDPRLVVWLRREHEFNATLQALIYTESVNKVRLFELIIKSIDVSHLAFERLFKGQLLSLVVSSL